MNKFLVSLTMGVITLVAASSASAQQLKGSEIKSLLSGKTFNYSGKTRGFSFYSSGGSVKVRDSKGGKLSGRWWVSGNSYCRKFGKGKTKCLTMRKAGAGKYRTSNGYTFWRQ